MLFMLRIFESVGSIIVLGFARPEEPEAGGSVGEIGERVSVIFERGFVRDGVRVEVIGPTGDVRISPVPEGEHYKVLRDAGFGFRGRLGDYNFADDSFSDGKNTSKILMEVHSITEITNLLIDVESLRSHIDLDMIMALQLEEITNTGFKYLIVSIIPDHTNLIQKQQRAGFRDKIAQMLNVEMPDTGHKEFVHIGIHIPSTL